MYRVKKENIYQSSYRYGLSRAPEPAATPPSFDFSSLVRSMWPQCEL